MSAASALALSFLIVGCDRTISKSESTSVSSDGTVKSKEKTVTEKPDGTPRELMDVTRPHNMGWKHRIGSREGIMAVQEEFAKSATVYSSGVAKA